MKSLTAVLLTAIFGLSFQEIAKAAAPGPVEIAVNDLEFKTGVDKSTAELMTDMLRTEIYNTGAFTVMNREDMDSILKEIKFQQSGACSETSCIVEMGQALGVGKMVSGSVGILGNSYVINAKLINVALMKNEVLASESVPQASGDKLPEAFVRMARKLAGQTSSVNASAPAPGARPSRLTVSTIDGNHWAGNAVATLNGKDMGKPPFSWEVTPGKQEVVLLIKNKPFYAASVQVYANEVVIHTVSNKMIGDWKRAKKKDEEANKPSAERRF